MRGVRPDQAGTPAGAGGVSIAGEGEGEGEDEGEGESEGEGEGEGESQSQRTAKHPSERSSGGFFNFHDTPGADCPLHRPGNRWRVYTHE